MVVEKESQCCVLSLSSIMVVTPRYLVCSAGVFSMGIIDEIGRCRVSGAVD
jgi:hypothetical protein